MIKNLHPPETKNFLPLTGEMDEKMESMESGSESSTDYEEVSLSDPNTVYYLDQQIQAWHECLSSAPLLFLELQLAGQEALRALQRLKFEVADYQLCHRVADQATYDVVMAVKTIESAASVVMTPQRIEAIIMLAYREDCENIKHCLRFVALLCKVPKAPNHLAAKIGLVALQKLFRTMVKNNHTSSTDIFQMLEYFNNLLGVEGLLDDDKAEFQETLKSLELHAAKFRRCVASDIIVGNYEMLQNCPAGVLVHQVQEIVLQVISLCTNRSSAIAKVLNLASEKNSVELTSRIVRILITLFHQDEEDNILDLMNVWAVCKGFAESKEVMALQDEDAHKISLTKSLKELKKHTNSFIWQYKLMLQREDTAALFQLHHDNKHLHHLVPLVLHTYLDGDLEKVNLLLRVSHTVPCLDSHFVFLQCINDSLTKFKQDGTCEKFYTLCQVNNLWEMLSSDASNPVILHKIDLLKTSAPKSLTSLIWSNPESPDVCISSRFENLPMHYSNSRVVVGSNGVRHTTWKSVVDHKKNVVYLKTSRKGYLSLYLATHSGQVGLSRFPMGWRVKSSDGVHVSLLSPEGNILLFETNFTINML